MLLGAKSTPVAAAAALEAPKRSHVAIERVHNLGDAPPGVGEGERPARLPQGLGVDLDLEPAGAESFG